MTFLEKKPKISINDALLSDQPERSRALYEFEKTAKKGALENYPNINKVVNLLSTFISEIHSKPGSENGKNDGDLQAPREMRSDGNEMNFNQRSLTNERPERLTGGTFANGWRAMPRNKNKFRSNPNWLFRPNLDNKPNPPQTVLTTTTTTTTTTTAAPSSSSSPSSSSNNLSNTTSASITIISSSTAEPIEKDKKDKGLVSSLKCSVNGKEYSNSQILPSTQSNPCIYCRCFYGKEMCHEQQCPTPPSPDCVSEKVEGQCCPTFTCRSTSDSESPPLTSLKPQVRRGPQYEPELGSEEKKQVKEVPVPEVEARQSQVIQQQTKPLPPRLGFPMDALPRPIEQLIFLGSRIHFPNNGNSMPGLRLPPNLPPQVIMSMHKNGALRPHFRPGQIVPSHILPMQHQFTKNKAKESPIRALPQSPIQLPSKEESPLPSISHPVPESSNNNPVIKEEPKTEIKIETTTTTTTTTAQAAEKNPWDIFKISGCNIYGKVYKAGEKIDKLSGNCKQCICSSQGVQCSPKVC